MNKGIKMLLMAGLLLSSTIHHVFAQNGVNDTSLMRSNGRIYVVIAVILCILAGLILYLIRLDRKITRLEKTTGNNKAG